MSVLCLATTAASVECTAAHFPAVVCLTGLLYCGTCRIDSEWNYFLMEKS